MRNAGYVLVAVMAVAAGCGTSATPSGRQQLQAGYQAIDRKDYEGAMRAAEQFLHDNPHNEQGTAEALYLKGRVYEQRAVSEEGAGRQAGAKMDLQTARSTYVRALGLKAEPRVVSLLHAGVANTAYFQDDFNTAMNEWAVAYPGIPQAEAKAWILYRIGVCQQRLGRFDQADRSFAQVRQEFSNSEPAKRAATHQGAKAFYVQVGAFADAANADKTIASLQSQGYRATKFVPQPNRQEVMVGPAYTYADAKVLQGKLLGAYPGAVIEP
jgi:tetratricopeptide (TPR) repeat protein